MYGSNRQELKDRYGRLIGWRQPLSDGRIEGYDHNGRYVGKYDPRRDAPQGETYDRHGRFIGKGDLLTSLITSSDR
jgi:hypothetical protein